MCKKVNTLFVKGGMSLIAASLFATWIIVFSWIETMYSHKITEHVAMGNVSMPRALAVLLTFTSILTFSLVGCTVNLYPETRIHYIPKTVVLLCSFCMWYDSFRRLCKFMKFIYLCGTNLKAFTFIPLYYTLLLDKCGAAAAA